MKKLALLLLIGVFYILLCSCNEPVSSPVEDFEYDFVDGEVVITGYTGMDLEIIVPNTIEERPVTVIGEKAFYEYDMTSIVIPNGVTTIERNAFSQCKNLENISFPDSIKSVYCYQGVDTGLEDTKWYENQPDGIVYIGKTLLGFKGNREEVPSEIAVKSGTICIADYAINSENLTKLSLPDSVKYIGDGAFYECPNLKSITVPESVEEIGIYSLGFDERIGILGYRDDIIKESVEDFEIYGKSGSPAETYAVKNNLTFVAK